ncbi:MAG: hypothetical protein H0W20_15715 [Chthoniobacterales bacterium]|nr:hypothetical protein [Chthoniobacterales bacterium]
MLRDLFYHDVALVGAGNYFRLRPEFCRVYELPSELLDGTQSLQLPLDDVLRFWLAVEEQAIRPDEVFACELHRVVKYEVTKPSITL